AAPVEAQPDRAYEIWRIANEPYVRCVVRRAGLTCGNSVVTCAAHCRRGAAIDYVSQHTCHDERNGGSQRGRGAVVLRPNDLAVRVEYARDEARLGVRSKCGERRECSREIERRYLRRAQNHGWHCRNISLQTNLMRHRDHLVDTDFHGHSNRWHIAR